jgi:hypothetical protein
MRQTKNFTASECRRQPGHYFPVKDDVAIVAYWMRHQCKILIYGIDKYSIQYGD